MDFTVAACVDRNRARFPGWSVMRVVIDIETPRHHSIRLPLNQQTEDIQMEKPDHIPLRNSVQR